MNKYIAHQRFCGIAICGEINIPCGAECECVDNIITYKQKPICICTSQSAKEHFALNNDGCGLKRGYLTHAMAFEHLLNQRQIDCLMLDKSYQKYRRTDCSTLLFSNYFFSAPILELYALAAKLGLKL